MRSFAQLPLLGNPADSALGTRLRRAFAGTEAPCETPIDKRRAYGNGTRVVSINGRFGQRRQYAGTQ